MKICIVCPRLCHGGAERVAVSLANGFVTHGHQVSFFTDLFEERTYLLDTSVKVYGLVSVSKPKMKKWWSSIWILHHYLKKEKPNILIGIMPLCSIISRIAAVRTGIPVIATEHNSYERPDSAPMPFMSRLYKFLVCKYFKKVTVLTNADKKIIGNRLRNTVVMENPLALDPIGIQSPRKKTILASGRVDNWHYKGFDVLIRAFGKLNESSKATESRSTFNSNDIAFKIESEGWKLVIAGVWRSPKTRSYLDGIAKECGVMDKIEYTGFVEDMQTLYAESSIFVLSSRYEAFGLVLIEAMSQGCACIACDYKGRQREIMSPTSPLPNREGESSVESPSLGTLNMNPDARPCRFRNYDGERTRNLPVEACETGILCEPDNVEALAEAMAKMITDDEYRESVREKAVKRSKYYSIENTMNRWESLLKQVTEIK